MYFPSELAVHVLYKCYVFAVFQVMLGRVGVYMASLLGRKRVSVSEASVASKKHGFRVTSSDVAQAYHLLHQISMTCELSPPPSGVVVIIALDTAPGVGGSRLKGLGLYLSLSALNFAETCRPQKQLPGAIISEMYFCLALQTSLSLPYLSSYAMVS